MQTFLKKLCGTIVLDPACGWPTLEALLRASTAGAGEAGIDRKALAGLLLEAARDLDRSRSVQPSPEPIVHLGERMRIVCGSHCGAWTRSTNSPEGGKRLLFGGWQVDVADGLAAGVRQTVMCSKTL